MSIGEGLFAALQEKGGEFRALWMHPELLGHS